MPVRLKWFQAAFVDFSSHQWQNGNARTIPQSQNQQSTIRNRQSNRQSPIQLLNLQSSISIDNRHFHNLQSAITNPQF